MPRHQPQPWDSNGCIYLVDQTCGGIADCGGVIDEKHHPPNRVCWILAPYRYPLSAKSLQYLSPCGTLSGAAGNG